LKAVFLAKCFSGREKLLRSFVKLYFPSYLDVIENAVSSGDTVFIENVEESVDPVLDPLLGRNTIKKGRLVASKKIKNA